MDRGLTYSDHIQKRHNEKGWIYAWFVTFLSFVFFFPYEVWTTMFWYI